jgi:hypothetical protein
MGLLLEGVGIGHTVESTLKWGILTGNTLTWVLGGLTCVYSEIGIWIIRKGFETPGSPLSAPVDPLL